MVLVNTVSKKLCLHFTILFCSSSKQIPEKQKGEGSMQDNMKQNNEFFFALDCFVSFAHGSIV